MIILTVWVLVHHSYLRQVQHPYFLECLNLNLRDLSTNPYIWEFLHSTVSDIKGINLTPKKNNLTYAQQQAIQKLKKHPDLVIKASDKGRNIVLVTKLN